MINMAQGSSSSNTLWEKAFREVDLGGLILGAHEDTIRQSFVRMEISLPRENYLYKDHISDGLSLFLFNFTDRTLHGIFEAEAEPFDDRYNCAQVLPVENMNRRKKVEAGDLYQRRYGGGVYFKRDWGVDSGGKEKVKFGIKKLCHPLTEDQYGPIVEYYYKRKFYFELDQEQKCLLISLFQETHGIPPKYDRLYEGLPGALKGQVYKQGLNERSSSEPKLPNNKNSAEENTSSHIAENIRSKSGAIPKTFGSSNALELMLEMVEEGRGMQELLKKLLEERDAIKLHTQRQEVRIDALEAMVEKGRMQELMKEIDANKLHTQRQEVRIAALEAMVEKWLKTGEECRNIWRSDIEEEVT